MRKNKGGGQRSPLENGQNSSIESLNKINLKAHYEA